MLVLPLKEPTESLLFLVKDQYSSPSLPTSLTGFSESDSSCSSSDSISSSSLSFFRAFFSARAYLFDMILFLYTYILQRYFFVIYFVDNWTINDFMKWRNSLDFLEPKYFELLKRVHIKKMIKFDIINSRCLTGSKISSTRSSLLLTKTFKERALYLPSNSWPLVTSSLTSDGNGSNLWSQVRTSKTLRSNIWCPQLHRTTESKS